MLERLTQIFELARDRVAGFIAISENDHKYIHQGRAFSVRGNTGSVAAAGTYYVTLTTPSSTSGKFIHLRPTAFFATANLTLLEVHEGSIVATPGSDATPINLNRNSTKTALTTVTVGSSSVTDGTQIIQINAGTAGQAGNSGGGFGTIAERVLKPGTIYTFKFTVIGATTASTAYYELFWYEEDYGI